MKKINWDEPIQTRDGRKASVIRKGGEGAFSVSCVVFNPDGTIDETEHNQYGDDSLTRHEFDVVNVAKTVYRLKPLQSIIDASNEIDVLNNVLSLEGVPLAPPFTDALLGKIPYEIKEVMSDFSILCIKNSDMKLSYVPVSWLEEVVND